MRAHEIVKKRPQGILTIFDIDDTLFHTTAKIRVIRDGKPIKSLDNQEFNNYKLQPGEEFDFGEFRSAEKFRQESLPIGPMLDELKTIIDHTRGTVIFLTARADLDNRDIFLNKFKDHGIDMSKIHVHRAGNLPGDSLPAEKKAVWIRKYLDSGGYNQVSFYDDSKTNLAVFKDLEEEYPEIEFHAYLVWGNGKVEHLDELWLRERKKKKSKRSRTPVYYGWWGGGYSSGEAGGGDGGGGVEEASYAGNIGMMELSKFFRVAKEEEKNQLKELIKKGKTQSAWQLIQSVTGVKLQGKEFGENFADGKNPGRKGLSKRVGIPKKATLTQLEKIAKNSGGERRRMAQWQLNMRRGRNK
jgi:hypothetical protein